MPDTTTKRTGNVNESAGIAAAAGAVDLVQALQVSHCPGGVTQCGGGLSIFGSGRTLPMRR